MTKAVIGMSGGVDSSVAAYLACRSGYDVTGVNMWLTGDESGCSGARQAALSLGIGFDVYDLREEFRKEVIDRFASSYEDGRTPNPCVICNRKLKFGLLYDIARERMGSDLMIATGHYAVVEKSPSGRFMMKKALDPAKDQSYFLSTLSQEQLSHAFFPLGGLTKSEVREIAGSLGLEAARRKDSQDICFIPDGDYAGFITEYTGRDHPAGDFIYEDGTVLGRHKGIINYTVGQRKGLGLSLKKPAYVLRLDKDSNAVVLGDDKDLYRRDLTVRDMTWVSIAPPERDIRCSARIRYRHREMPATCIPLGEGLVRIVFDEPVRAVTPGQTAVLYDGDYVLGGGEIC